MSSLFHDTLTANGTQLNDGNGLLINLEVVTGAASKCTLDKEIAITRLIAKRYNLFIPAILKLTEAAVKLVASGNIEAAADIMAFVKEFYVDEVDS